MLSPPSRMEGSACYSLPSTRWMHAQQDDGEDVKEFNCSCNQGPRSMERTASAAAEKRVGTLRAETGDHHHTRGKERREGATYAGADGNFAFCIMLLLASPKSLLWEGNVEAEPKAAASA